MSNLFNAKNSFYMSPVKTAMAEPGTGKITLPQIQYYEKRAKGGVGTIILEPVAVTTSGKEHPKQMMLEDSQSVELLKNLVDSLKKSGARVVVHLNHAGRAANPAASGGRPLAPASLPCPMSGQTAEILDMAQIREIEDAFAAKAVIAQNAGADGVELQMGHGYLAAQFMSGKLNNRTDEYGKNHFLFAENVLKKVTSAVQIPVIARISGAEFTENLTDEDETEMLDLFQKYAIAGIHVGWGNACETPAWYYNHMALPLEKMDEKLVILRQKTRLPIIAAGRMQTNDRYKTLLENGTIDGVVMGRQLITDPDYVNKILGKQKTIRCAGCLQGCLTSVKAGKPVTCIANPEASRDLIPTGKSSRTAMVIGGGPAGIYTGIYLARKGLKVTLFEKEKNPGGQWNLAYKVPGKGTMKNTLDDLVTIAEDFMEIKTGVHVDEKYVLSQNYDEVVVATGALPVEIPIPGLTQYITGFDVYKNPESIKNKNVLIIGGGMIGMEAAEILLPHGNQITVVEMLEEISRGMDPVSRGLLMKAITGKVNILTRTKVSRTSDSEVFIQNESGESSLGKFDVIVMAIGTRPENSLYEKLNGKVKKLHIVGDAEKTAQIMEASVAAYSLSGKIAG